MIDFCVLVLGNWGDDFPAAEDWDNEEYTGSLADTKVFTPSGGGPSGPRKGTGRPGMAPGQNRQQQQQQAGPNFAAAAGSNTPSSSAANSATAQMAPPPPGRSRPPTFKQLVPPPLEETKFNVFGRFHKNFYRQHRDVKT